MAWARPRAGGGECSSPGHALQGEAVDSRKRVVKCRRVCWPGRWEVELPSRKMARLRKSAGLSRKFLLVVQWKYLEDTKPTSSTE